MTERLLNSTDKDKILKVVPSHFYKSVTATQTYPPGKAGD